MTINSGKGMRFYQPPGGGGGGAVNILIQISAQLQALNQTIQGLQQLQNTAVSVSQTSAAEIGAFGAVFDKVADGIVEAAKKVGEAITNFIEDSVKKAAEIQTESFPLAQLFRDQGDIAREVLEGIHSAWQQIGVITSEEAGRAVKNLALMEVPAENVLSRFQDLAKMAVSAGESVTIATSAYQRFLQGIQTDSVPATRGMGAFGTSTLLIFRALEDHFHVAQGELRAMFQAGQISVDDLNKAIHEAATGAGVFADAFEQKKATFDGAVQAMETAWQAFQIELGKPIIDFLTPIINRITVFEQRLIEVSQHEGWKIALKAAWEVVLDEMVIMIKQILVPGFVDLAAGAADAFAASFQKWLFQTFPKVAPSLAKMIFGDDISFASLEQANKALNVFLDKVANPDTAKVEAAKAKFKDILKGILIPSKDWIDQQADEIWFEFLSHPPPPVLMPEVVEPTHRADAAKQLAAALHELEAAMNAVREQQNLISGAPFMGIDDKTTAEIKAVETEMGKLQIAMAKLQAMKDTLPLNPAQMAELNTRLQTAEARFTSLGVKLGGLLHPLQAELQRWANSFGSVSQQIGKTIESSIGTALQSVNQFLVTGKFNAQALLQQLILLGLQLVEQLIIQQVMGAINRSAAVAEAEIMGPAITAAMTPAATAMTIATEGEAAAQAPAAVGTALAAIELILGAGAVKVHSGGEISRAMRRFHDGGGLSFDEVPIIAQAGEIMIRRDVAQAPGMTDFLLGLNRGIFHRGGSIRRLHEGGREFDPDFNPDDPPWVLHVHPGPPLPQHWAHPHVTDVRVGDFEDIVDNPTANAFLNLIHMGNVIGFGPSMGTEPTWWVNYPGVGPVPMAVPNIPGGWTGDPSQEIKLGVGTPKPEERHGGGLIGRSLSLNSPRTAYGHSGGLIARMHSGGMAGAAAMGAGVHIYAFTDLKALTKHMGSREGQKIIFDTVKGRRIDLGIS